MLDLKARDQLEYYDSGFGYNCSYEFPFLHTHDYWEFCYIVHDFKHIINGRTETIYANSVMVVKPSDEHLISALPSKFNPNKAPTHLNIKISKEKLRELLDVISPKLYGFLENSAPIVRQLNEDSSAKILKNFLSVLLWNNNKEENLVMLKTALFLIIGLFYNEIYGKTVFNIEQPQEVNEVIQKMNSRKYLASPISEITEGCNYSYMQLTRIFKKTTGLTMQDYFLYVKLEYAADQLRLTHRLTLDISNDIGISSLSHFNHIFKKRFGIPPGEYRKRTTLSPQKATPPPTKSLDEPEKP